MVVGRPLTEFYGVAYCWFRQFTEDQRRKLGGKMKRQVVDVALVGFVGVSLQSSPHSKFTVSPRHRSNRHSKSKIISHSDMIKK